MDEMTPERFANLVRMARSAAAANPTRTTLDQMEPPSATARWLRHEMIGDGRAPSWLLAEDGWMTLVREAYVLDAAESETWGGFRPDSTAPADIDPPVASIDELGKLHRPRPRRCGIFRRRHVDVVADPAIPHRLVCSRCGQPRYRGGG